MYGAHSNTVNGWFFAAGLIYVIIHYVYTTTGAEISVSGIFGSE